MVKWKRPSRFAERINRQLSPVVVTSVASLLKADVFNPTNKPPTLWRKKYGQMAMAEIRRVRQLEEENLKRKQLVAELTLDTVMLQEVLTKKRSRPRANGNWSDT